MNTKEILIAAKALIDAPEKWTQGDYARDASGNSVSFKSKDAVCFCSLGAIHKVAKGKDFDDAEKCLREILNGDFRSSLHRFNDAKNHKEVIELFDAAIARCDA